MKRIISAVAIAIVTSASAASAGSIAEPVITTVETADAGSSAGSSGNGLLVGLGALLLLGAVASSSSGT